MKAYTQTLICDVCGVAACKLGNFAYNDDTCDFAVCEPCYTNLPETHELVPFKMPKSVLDHLFAEQNQEN